MLLAAPLFVSLAAAPEATEAEPAREVDPGSREAVLVEVPLPEPDVVPPESAKEVGAADGKSTTEADARPVATDTGREVAAKEAASPLRPKAEQELLREHPVHAKGARWRPGHGLEMKSKDGKFGLVLRPRVQLRYTMENGGEEDELAHSFEIRRARLELRGHLFGEHNKLETELAFSPRDLGLENGALTHSPLLTWAVEFDHLRDLTLRLGQYKVPYSRERVFSSGNLELVDRSLASAEFALDRDLGLDLHSRDFMGWRRLRYYAGVYSGEGRDAYRLDDYGLTYVGRIEVLPMGSFADYSQGDFERSKRPRLSLGVGYAFVDEAKRNRGIVGDFPTDGGKTDYHNVTADVLFKIVGLSVQGELHWRKGQRSYGSATVVNEAGEEEQAPLEPSRDGIGWFAQAGYLIPRIPLGLACRYGQVRGIGDGEETSLPDQDEIGGGLGWYIAGHPLKLQADYFRVARDVYDVRGRAFTAQSLGDGDDVFRLQLQAAF